MQTTVLEGKPEILDRVAELQDQVTAMKEQLDALVRGIGGIQVILPELHDDATGQIDAQKLATYLGVPLKRLSEGLQLNYKAVHRHPSAQSFQSPLKPVKRVAEILHDFFQKPEWVRVWLNTPHPDLDGQTALEMILRNNVGAVLRILENANSGVPA